MSMKPKTFLQNGMHTAGIFSDLSVDGPEIGTVVAVVDRAKNLPNRKTIGKQDPYCAARLGKEAKKTATDIRGGQTPKWDQELRFVVHDSPDYYQLKVSVFNDDKRTDLIGETWIDLRDIIVPGGGQSDLWHSLSYKGKYAGEVRMEITYYDSRPKPEKSAAAKPKPVVSDQQDGPKPASRTPVKRRPLPSDPVTGEVPEQHIVTPARPHPKQPPVSAYAPNQSPLQAVDYNPPPSAPRQHQPEPYGYSPHSAPNPNSYGTSPARMDMSQQPHTPTSANRYDAYSNRQHDERDYSPRQHGHTQPSPHHRDSRGFYGSRSDRYDSPPTDNYRQELPAHDERPPPPPVHRSRHNSSVSSQDMVMRSSLETTTKGTSPMRHDVLKYEAHRRAPSYPGRPAYRPYDSSPAAPNPMSSPADNNALYHQPSPSHHRSLENGNDSYRSMQPTVEDVPESPTPARRSSGAYAWPPQHDEPTYDQQAAPAAPAPLNTTSNRGSVTPGQYDRSPQYAAVQYDQSPSPAPLSLNGKGNNTMSPQYNAQLQPDYHNHDDYRHHQPPSVSPLSQGQYDLGPAEGSQNSHVGQGQYASQANELQGNELQLYGRPSVPPSLVPGPDPTLALEVANQIHHEPWRQERHYTHRNVDTQPRGRYHPEHANYAWEDAHGSPQPYVSRSYDERSAITYPNGPPAQNHQLVKARSVSPNPMPMPNPQHTIKRKSVSPAPPPRDDPSEGRRLSGVPFSPDSYDALNPVLSGTDTTELDSHGKIITHDGREIDPSDHLPMESWAPEPEPKPAKAPPPETRPRPNGAQPMPPSGRRPLRVAGRPHSQSAAPAPASSYAPSDGPPLSHQNGPRNRLQKKTQRASALPAPHPADSGPLAPLSSHNYQGGQDNGYAPPQPLARASTWDHPIENHAPQYGSSPGNRAMTGPPLPAKVPLPMMSGALAPVHGGGEPSSGDWALMQEMSRIDIGTGRSRRHGGY